jgi:anti-sigma factor RsiW
MNCQETINLWSSYRDGELDAAFCGEIQRHLETCPECRRFFEAQGQFDATLVRALNQGQPTESLWQREESAIRAAFQPPARPPEASVSFWAAWLSPSPKFFGAMAAVWALLLVVNHLAEVGSPASGNGAMPAPEQQAALAEQRREFKVMLMVTDFEQTRPVVRLLGPRSERRAEPDIVPVGRAGKMEGIEEPPAELA